VGVAASFTDKKRRELVEFLTPYRRDALAEHPWKSWAAASFDAPGAAGGPGGEQRVPGGKSRWSGGKDLSWEPVRTELVVEVGYDHMQGSRFRHTAQFRRFRSDKPPATCTYAQLEVVPPEELASLFAKG
jgi:ATP-dependent DNA ligase